jgi:alpha-beta hydrolase superfamily lysophospholipase
MLNHDPLFEVLVNDGYRVIAFDYMGQGGSAGSMNDTRIKNINQIGDAVVKLLSRKNGPDGDQYHIIGRSTGGLAAYRQAFYDGGSTKKAIRSIMMLAPGIAPNYFVGEGIWNWPILEISMRTLTNNKLVGVNDPHHDPIWPKSPVHVLSFALDLQATAKAMRNFGFISKDIKGITFLSGPNDTYVNAAKTKSALKSKAPHFTIKEYAAGLHELDNEVDSIAKDVRKSILEFLNSQY